MGNERKSKHGVLKCECGKTILEWSGIIDINATLICPDCKAEVISVEKIKDEDEECLNQ